MVAAAGNATEVFFQVAVDGGDKNKMPSLIQDNCTYDLKWRLHIRPI